MSLKRAVFLDRDGVINQSVVRAGKPYPPANVQEVRLVQHVTEGLHQLKAQGFLLLVVTNQPDIRRGITSQQSVEEIHQFLAMHLPIDDFFICPHDDEDYCLCRKPSPGLLWDGAQRYGIDIQKSFLIGDRWRDIDAGAAAGCQTALIDYGYRERQPQHSPDIIVSSLMEAVNWIIKKEDLSL